MTSGFNCGKEGLVVSGRITVPFNYSAGRTASRFLKELRDHRRILGKRCPNCLKVWAPPQAFCVECFVEAHEWVELPPDGLLLAHSWVALSKPHRPPLNPLIYGLIRLRGASNNFVHLIRTDDPSDLKNGTRVKAVFSEQRRGHILDIAYFCPV